MEIKGREVLKIKAIAGTKDYAADSKLKGEQYRLFAFGGKVFIANVKDAFCTAFDTGKVYSIDLGVNDEGLLSLDGFTSIDQEMNMAKTEAMLKVFTADNFLAGKLKNIEELADLG